METADGTVLVEGGQIFINTGARPFVPPIPGLKESRYFYLSETMMELRELPRRLVIIGGGYIGMEFASMYANFGSEVTVIQDGEAFLPREDREIAQAVLSSLNSRGIRVLLSVQVEKVEDQDDQAVVTLKTPDGSLELTADAVLAATGRRPNVSGLNPEAAGVELTSRGGGSYRGAA